MDIKELNILGKKYKIVPMDNPHKRNLFGFHDACACEIRVNTDQAEDMLRDTLLHEAIHALEYAGSVGLKEPQVAALSPLLINFLKSNPEFTEWLLRTEEKKMDPKSPRIRKVKK